MPEAPAPSSRKGSSRAGLWLDGVFAEIHRVLAFSLIVLGSMATGRRRARRLVKRLILQEIYRSGVRVAPVVGFLAAALGILFVGQTAALLNDVGQSELTGALMVTVVVRELGPLVAGMVVLARAGSAAVIELGTARAMGEVEALEALGIDPLRYLVAPRLVGLTVSIACLSAYFVAVALLFGYAFAFTRGLPLTLGQFFGEIARAMSWTDFPVLLLKTALFGAVTGMVVCYEALTRPLRLENIGEIASRAVAACVVGCLAVDGLLIPLQWLA